MEKRKMFNKIKKWFNKNPLEETKPRSEESSNDQLKAVSPKETATALGEAYIAILQVSVDPNDINNGSFELDWNDKFIVNLIRQGYRRKPEEEDSVIVDRWFQTVCRNIALEVYEQQQADPDNRDPLLAPSEVRIVQHRDLGDGRTEIS